MRSVQCLTSQVFIVSAGMGDILKRDIAVRIYSSAVSTMLGIACGADQENSFFFLNSLVVQKLINRLIVYNQPAPAEPVKFPSMYG